MMIKPKRHKPHPCRLRLVFRCLTNQKSSRKSRKKPKRKRKEEDIKENKIGKNDETIAPSQWELMPCRLQKAKRRSNRIARTLREISMRLLTINAIRKATTPEIALSQKTSCSLSNFHIDDY